MKCEKRRCILRWRCILKMKCEKPKMHFEMKMHFEDAVWKRKMHFNLKEMRFEDEWPTTNPVSFYSRRKHFTPRRTTWYCRCSANTHQRTSHSRCFYEFTGDAVLPETLNASQFSLSHQILADWSLRYTKHDHNTCNPARVLCCDFCEKTVIFMTVY